MNVSPIVDHPNMESDADVLTPRAPHDGLSFAELAESYNFRNISDRRRVFTRLIVDELKTKTDATVLDIGCGRGMARDSSWQWAIKNHAATYWGIEPDATVAPPAGLFDACHVTTMDDAQLPSQSVDLAYSFMVMEHVADPVQFCRQLYDCMKPGATYYFATPNLGHYFTRIALAFKLLKTSEAAVKLFRRDKVEEYHYPVQYRFNSPRQIQQAATQVGFEMPEFVYMEAVGPKPYFPGPTRIIFQLLAQKRVLIKRPGCLLTMVGRLRRPLGN